MGTCPPLVRLAVTKGAESSSVDMVSGTRGSLLAQESNSDIHAENDLSPGRQEICGQRKSKKGKYYEMSGSIFLWAVIRRSKGRR